MTPIPPHASRHVDGELRHFTEACRTRGTPVTHQRLAVYRALLESRSHPDAEALHQALRRTVPTLSLATVYKTLEMLESLGLARAVAWPGAKRRFDGNRQPHHHLWCTRCRRLIDVELDPLAHVAPPAGLDFQVSDFTIQFNGTCTDCRAHDSAAKPARAPVRPQTPRREPHDE